MYITHLGGSRRTRRIQRMQVLPFNHITIVLGMGQTTRKAFDLPKDRQIKDGGRVTNNMATLLRLILAIKLNIKGALSINEFNISLI